MTLSDTILDLAAKRFSVDRSTLSVENDLFESLQIDSLQALDLLTELEEAFGVEIPDYELQEVRSFQELVDVVERHGATARS